jgi:ubiquinone/menaquinone biosynthesis C-methylase UbiE
VSGIKIFSPEYYARMRELEAASWWNAAMRDVAGSMIEAVGLPDSGLLLDVGCGSGQTMDWFRGRWKGWRTVGLDVAMDGLRAARQVDENVFKASALEIPLPDSAVDAIITQDVLQHLPLNGGDVRALREVHRVLRPGGLLMIRTNAQTWPPAADDPVYDFHKYTAPELRQKLEETGFRVMRLGKLNALLGLAEIPRDLRAQKAGGDGYHGLLAEVPSRNLAWHAKRGWLRMEGAMVAAGLSLPLGRSLVAVAMADAK